MTKYINKLKENVIEQIKSYEKGKVEIQEDEIEKVMTRVVEFYNAHPEDEDVFRIGNGCILLIQTPKKIVIEGETVNSARKFPGFNEGDPDRFLLQDCKFRIYGTTRSIGLWAEMDLWKEFVLACGGKEVYDLMGFVKTSDLKLTYGKMGDLYTSGKKKDKLVILTLKKFLERHEIESLDEMEESEYLTFYSATIQQVIH